MKRSVRPSVTWPTNKNRAPGRGKSTRSAEFPWDVFETLPRTIFAAVHIPEGVRAARVRTAIATAIVIEESRPGVARRSSADPGGEQAWARWPLPCWPAPRELKQRYLAAGRPGGEAMFS